MVVGMVVVVGGAWVMAIGGLVGGGEPERDFTGAGAGQNLASTRNRFMAGEGGRGEFSTGTPSKVMATGLALRGGSAGTRMARDVSPILRATPRPGGSATTSGFFFDTESVGNRSSTNCMSNSSTAAAAPLAESILTESIGGVSGILDQAVIDGIFILESLC